MNVFSSVLYVLGNDIRLSYPSGVFVLTCSCETLIPFQYNHTSSRRSDTNYGASCLTEFPFVGGREQVTRLLQTPRTKYLLAAIVMHLQKADD